MPVFRYRMEDPDSNHFRTGSIVAASKEEAAMLLEMREPRKVLYRLGEEDLEAFADRIARGDRLRGADRAHFAIHKQERPYKLVSLEERS